MSRSERLFAPLRDQARSIKAVVRTAHERADNRHFSSMGFVIARISRWHGDRPRWAQALAAGVLSLAIATLSTGTATAVEPAEAFVKGLQERGLHELALEYLEGLKTSPVADDATKQRIPYLRGVALIEQSRQTSEPAARNKMLDEARKELEAFAEANPQNVQGAEAQQQLATVQMNRGMELVAQATQLPKEKAYDAQRRELGHDARLRFAEARDTYQRAETTYSSELDKLPPAATADGEEETGSRRQELRSRVAELRFHAAQTQFEAAQSYPPEADEFRKLNETAAQELSAVYDEFSRQLVGLYARMYEGRCYQTAGKYTEALGCYEEILGKINAQPAFQKLIGATSRRKAEVLIAQAKFGDAIDICNSFLKDAHKDEERQPEWLAVRFRLADALEKKAQVATADSPEQRKLTAEARDAYRLVAKFPGEFQVAARSASALAAAATTPATAEEDASPKNEPKTFQAAYDLGKEALSNYNAAKVAMPSAERNNPTAVPELQAEMDHGKADARRYFKIASTLVEDDTDPKQLNEVRYFLCWLYWDAEDYFRAAVLGEFLARRYPDTPSASSAARISMASFERLASLDAGTPASKDNGDFEARQMAKMAELIARRWPGTPEADSAFGVLVSFAIRSGKTEDAEKLLQQASAASRPRLELLLGNAMWIKYLELSQPDNAETPDAEALASIKASAMKYLQSGYDAAKKESPLSDAGATAALRLAQVMLNDGDYKGAIELLEDKTTGPLTLIEKGHSLAAKPAYATDAYKAALRAYVSVMPPQEKKAISTMQALEQVVRSSGGDDAKTNEQLTRIYVSMGVALQKQMEELRAAGKQREANRVADAFAKFLDRISGEQKDAGWPIRSWIAQTYYSMGTSGPKMSSAIPAVLGKAARENLSKARDSYQQLIQEAEKDPKVAPTANAVIGAKMQLGECYRALGQYQQAIETYSSILNEKDNLLEVQRAAALAYQEWGQQEDPKYLENAIHGGILLKSKNQNRIWGWLKISQATVRGSKTDEKFRDAFFEARLNVARCRYLAALKLTGDARQQDLTKAAQSVQSVVQLYPELGGEKSKAAYDELLKDIEEAEKESPDGKKDSANADSDAKS